MAFSVCHLKFYCLLQCWLALVSLKIEYRDEVSLLAEFETLCVVVLFVKLKTKAF